MLLASRFVVGGAQRTPKMLILFLSAVSSSQSSNKFCVRFWSIKVQDHFQYGHFGGVLYASDASPVKCLTTIKRGGVSIIDFHCEISVR